MRRLAFFYREDNHAAKRWAKRLSIHIQKRHRDIKISDKRPQFVIALGGDGTVLEAARTFRGVHPTMVGLNLGHVGFLASARRPRDFIKSVDLLLNGKHHSVQRMMASAKLIRKGRSVAELHALNEISVQALLGVIKLRISVDGYPVQYIHGGGVLVSTPTGSTAYNLSAHGPIITPDIKCLVVTELLDHHIPTPPLVVKHSKKIVIDITELRKRGLFNVSRSGERVDAVITADEGDVIPVLEGDRIEVTRARHLIRFAEFERGYFYKSLEEKFAFQ
jgi:NAD+ kinase